MALKRMNIEQVTDVKTYINLGATLDIPTSEFIKGVDGETIINGGMGTFIGILGLPNLGKSLLSYYMIFCVLRTVKTKYGVIYDTEQHMTRDRVKNLAQRLGISDDIFAEGILDLTSATEYLGDKYFDLHKEWCIEKGNDKDNTITTPFADKEGKPIKVLVPTVQFTDSLSEFKTKDVVKMEDENSLGDKGGATLYMRQGLQKRRYVDEMSDLGARYNVRTIMTGHLGKKIEMDMYNPEAKQLSYIKGNVKGKGIPENFDFLTTTEYQVMSLKPMIDKGEPIFPHKDDVGGKTDLSLMTIVILRCKHGLSGVVHELVVSQSEGILPHLTEFHNLRSNKYYGLVGGNVKYHCALYPEVTMSRVTARDLLEKDTKLQRAVQICSEMQQIYTYKTNLDPELVCTPEQLYEDIKSLGYDWDILLQTRGYWTEVGVSDVPYLSTMDLLNMRAGRYTPKWYKKDTK